MLQRVPDALQRFSAATQGRKPGGTRASRYIGLGSAAHR